MSERRRFAIEPAQRGQVISLGVEESAHILRVLRLKGGECLEGVDGRGWVYELRLCSAKGGRARVEVLERTRAPRGFPLNVLVAVGLIKGQRMDWAVEKAAELGARALVPFLSQRTIAAPDHAGGKVLRWRRIARAAMKQSLSAYQMAVYAPRDLDYVVRLTRSVAFCLVGESNAPPLSLRGLELNGAPACLVVIGPEGALTPQESARLEQAGARFFSLGQARLRTETAVAATLAALWQAFREGGA